MVPLVCKDKNFVFIILGLNIIHLCNHLLQSISKSMSPSACCYQSAIFMNVLCMCYITDSSIKAEIHLFDPCSWVIYKWIKRPRRMRIPVLNKGFYSTLSTSLSNIVYLHRPSREGSARVGMELTHCMSIKGNLANLCSIKSIFYQSIFDLPEIHLSAT